MAPKKGGLGKGLGSLFEDSAAGIGEAAAPTILRITEIEPDKDQPRKHFDDTALSELASSIMQHGVLQPLVVRSSPTGGYKIVAGERRWRAARLAGLKEVPVVVKELTDAAAMEIALIENLQREDLDVVEEALGYQQLIERCNYTQETAAAKLGKSRSAVTNCLRLLKLPKPVQELLRTGKLSAGHAKAILSLPDEDLQQEAADLIVLHALNVRQAEALCKKMAKAPRKKRMLQRPALPGEVEISLREVLGTEVKVKYQEGKGTLLVDFYSDDQLKAFANLLGNYPKN